MKIRNRIIALGLSVVMCLCTTACTGQGEAAALGGADFNDDGDKYIKVWVPLEEVEITQKMCDMFVEKQGYDNLTIECLAMSYGDSMTSLTVDCSTAADIFQYATGETRYLADSGFLLPIALNYEELKEKFDATAFESVSVDNFMYGIPFNPNTWVMYYNKDIFTEEDVKSIETMLKKETGLKYNFSCSISSNWYIEAFFFGMGCTLFGEDGKQHGQCTWNQSNGYEVSKYLIELANTPGYYENLNGYAYDYFVEGELGAFCSSLGTTAGLKAVLGDKLGVVKLPVANIAGKEVQLKNFIDYTAFGVNSHTQYPKEAQELAIWLGGEECQLMRYEQFGVIPTLTTLFENEALKGDIEVGAFLCQLEHCVIVPQILQIRDYWASATAFGEGIVQGTITEENLQHYLDVLVENITVDFIAD